MPGHCETRRVIMRPVNYRLTLPNFGAAALCISCAVVPFEETLWITLAFNSDAVQCCLNIHSNYLKKVHAAQSSSLKSHSNQEISRSRELPPITTHVEGGRPTLAALAFQGGQDGGADGHHETLRSGG